MTAPLLKLSNVNKTFGAVQALRDISFELQPGEVHALVGENGAGKTTLIKLITGAHLPDSGTIEVDGRAVHGWSPVAAHQAGIAAIYQQPALFPDLSVAENIALRLGKPCALRLVNWKQNRRRALELLDRVGARIDPMTEVRQLSLPQQQLVVIAGALVAGARSLIMDEPTSALPAAEVELLLSLVDSLRRQRVGIIYVSHRLGEIFRVADRVTVLRDGQTVGTRDRKHLTEAELIQMMIGRQLSTIFPPAEKQPGQTLLSVTGLGCSFSGIHNVTFDVRAGEVLGLAGLVGAGRTELARVLFGITPPDSGTISIEGKPLRINCPRDAIEAGIGYVPEDRRRHGVILEMPITANVTISIPDRLFPRGWLRVDEERALVQRYIGELAIKTGSEQARVGDLSGGNQQKVALARWLAAEPKLLILDEPTQGVDVGAKAEIHKLIRQLTARGLAVLMISSELPEILRMSHRIAVMRGGTITAILEASQANAHKIMAAAVGQPS